MLTNIERADKQFIQAEESLRHMRRFTDFKNKRCLEIGCHLGGLSTYYALHGVKLEAIDCEQGEKVLEFARDYARKKGAMVTFRWGDVHNLHYGDNSFDILIMDNILEHLSDFRKALSECKRVLKKGGLLFMNFSLFYGPFGGHQDSVPWYHLLPERLIRKRLERENIYGLYKTLNKITLTDTRKAIRALGFKVIYFHRASALSAESRAYVKKMIRLIVKKDFSELRKHMKKLNKITLSELGKCIFFSLLLPTNFIPIANEFTIAGIQCVLKSET